MRQTGQIGELRGAVRFPLHLPLELNSPQDEHKAETGDISSGGLLFYMDTELAAGSAIEFSIIMPADVLGVGAAVRVRCVGRVVRSFMDEGRRAIAAVIDEYNFERA